MLHPIDSVVELNRTTQKYQLSKTYHALFSFRQAARLVYDHSVRHIWTVVTFALGRTRKFLRFRSHNALDSHDDAEPRSQLHAAWLDCQTSLVTNLTAFLSDYSLVFINFRHRVDVFKRWGMRSDVECGHQWGVSIYLFRFKFTTEKSLSRGF